MDSSSDSAALEAALAYLYGRVNYERSSRIPYQERHFKLDRMRRLLAALGNPQAAVPAVHIAGTKGKGSTAAFTASILHAAGYRTGVYTSPHLDRLEQRFVVDGQACSTGDLVELVGCVRSAVEAEDLDADATYFELTTAMAFLHFQRRQVDVGVLEVGLGGRLDSTNVCRPVVTAITSISFDHQRQLGSTLSEIAAEKAGIIKRGVPVICGVREPAARRVIRRRSEQLGSPLRLVDEDFFYRLRRPDTRSDGAASDASRAEQPIEHVRFDFWREGLPDTDLRRDLRLGVLGEHQARNAATSLAVVDELRSLGWSISARAQRQGLADTVCPARVEMVGNAPPTIIDAAHNIASCEALVATLRDAFPRREKTLIFATSQDKDADGMLRVLLPHFARVVLTRYRHNPRTVDPNHLLELTQRVLAETGVDGRQAPVVAVAPDPDSAWQMARSTMQSGELLCVTGSFFLAAELRSHARSSCIGSSQGGPSQGGPAETCGPPPRR